MGKSRNSSIDYILWRYIKIIILTIYILSPIDILPDFIPIIGGIDDTVALFMLGYLLFEDWFSTVKSKLKVEYPILHILFSISIYSILLLIPISTLLIIIKLF